MPAYERVDCTLNSFGAIFILPISTLPGPIDEENTYPQPPKYYFLIKTGLENGPKNGPKNSPNIVKKIVQGSIGPVHILPYAIGDGYSLL